MSAAAEITVPVEACAACGLRLRIPTLAAKRNFEARGNRCIQCAAEPGALEQMLDEMLAATDWAKIPLAAKLAICAEVAR